MVFVAISLARISIPQALSLKDKRRVVQRLKAQLRREFNLAVAEVEANENPRLAVLGLVSVSNEARYLEGQVGKIENRIEQDSEGLLEWFEHKIEKHGLEDP